MGESPFRRKKSVMYEREKSTYESFEEYFKIKLNDMFLAHVPSDDIKAMSPEYRYPLGLLALLGLLGIFIAIFLNGFLQSKNTLFLSPSTSDTAMKNCIIIPTINTGDYLATIGGIWQGASGFLYAEASYVFSVTSLSIDPDTYAFIMEDGYRGLALIASEAEVSDLGSNLLTWMSGVYLPILDNPAQRLSFVGSALIVFNRQKIVGTMSNVNGSCNATSTAIFDSSSGILSLQYAYAEYMASPQCAEIVAPPVFGYYREIDGARFSINIDVRTIVTCVSVNTGIISLLTLNHIPANDGVIVVNNFTYAVQSYYDPKYSGMQSIACMLIPYRNIGIDADENFTSCAMVVENLVYAVPMFSHAGKSSDFPIPCNCSTLTYSETDDKYDPCNVFSFLSGVLFYPNNDAQDVANLFLESGASIYFAQLSAQGVPISPLNNYAFYPMWNDGFFGQNSPNRSSFNSPVNREAAYAFCNIPGVGNRCSFITFSLFDLTASSWTISPYYYQVQTGACQNTFVGSEAQWNNLIEHPFAPLTQDYQKCHYDTSTIVINQAGSSVGTVSILAPLCITFILVLAYFAQSCGMANIKKTYTNTEKDSALDDLALKLLLVRDSDKTKHTVPDKSGVLAQLVEALGEDLQNEDSMYHSTASSKEGESSLVNWSNLRAKLSTRKANLAQRSNTVDMEDGVGLSSAYPAVELKSISSPIHFLDSDVSAQAMAANRDKYTIMNDYEVTPALKKLCSVMSSPIAGPYAESGKQTKTERNKSISSIDERLEAGDDMKERINSSNTPILNKSALFALLDELSMAFEAAVQDRGKSVWSEAARTAILRTIKLSSLSHRDCSTLYYKLSVLLNLHAASMLHLSVEEVREKKAGTVAYIIGAELFTLEKLREKL